MRRLYFGLAIAALLIVAASGVESIGGSRAALCSSSDSVGCATEGCSTCGLSGVCSECVAECTEKKSKASSFEIECKKVCVPPVRVPGCGEILANLCGNRTVGELKTTGNGCTDGCGEGCMTCEPCEARRSLLARLFQCSANGRVRTVGVLKTLTKEKIKPAIKWSVRDGATHGCTTGECTTGGCTEGCRN